MQRPAACLKMEGNTQVPVRETLQLLWAVLVCSCCVTTAAAEGKLKLARKGVLLQ